MLKAELNTERSALSPLFQLQYFNLQYDEIEKTFKRDIDFARMFKFKNLLRSEPIRQDITRANTTAVSMVISDSLSPAKIEIDVSIETRENYRSKKMLN